MTQQDWLLAWPVFLLAVKRMEGRDMEQFMRQLEEVVVMLEKQVTNFKARKIWNRWTLIKPQTGTGEQS